MAGEPDVNAAAVFDGGELTAGVTELEVHAGVAGQHLDVRSRFPDGLDGEARSDQVVVLIDVLVLMKTLPATFGFNLHPAREMDVDEGAHAGKVVGAVVRGEQGARPAAEDGKLPGDG